MNLTIAFKSDWHVGSGAGIPGLVDRCVLRDQNGLPYLPAKTITGILRDAGEFVSQQLDAIRADQNLNISVKGSWSDVLRSLFGSQRRENYRDVDVFGEPPIHARLEIRPGHLAPSMREVILGETNPVSRSGSPSLIDALFFVQPGVAVDSRTGRAKDKHLFMTEHVRAGCIFQSDVCVIGDSLKVEEAALLHAAIAAVRRLGGKRRRGAGRCGMKLTGGMAPPEFPDWLTWLERNIGVDLSGHLLESKTRDFSKSSPSSGLASSPSSVPTTSDVESWIGLALKLEAHTPLVIIRSVLGNVVNTLDYVPGTLLLSHVFKVLSRDLGPECVRQAISRGEIIMTNFTPQVGAKPSYQVPQCLFFPKGGKGLESTPGQYNNPSHRPLNLLLEKASRHTQLKGYRNGWITLGERSASSWIVPPQYDDGKSLLTQRTHNTVEDSVQRPSEEVGGVYTYEAIKAGTTLLGDLWISPSIIRKLEIAQRDKTWFSGLSSKVTLGRSKKDDYGLARLEIVGQSTLPESGTLSDSSNNQFLIVWLISDLLLRDQHLSYSGHPHWLKEELSGILGVPLEHATPDALAGDISSIGRVRRLESWHQGWGLPRPSLTGLQAGSVFVFKVLDSAKLDRDKIEELQKKGIGDRRAEGYGRMLFNPAILCTKPMDWTLPILSSHGDISHGMLTHAGEVLPMQAKSMSFIETPANLCLPMTPEDIDFLQRVEAEAWRGEIRLIARGWAYSDDLMAKLSQKCENLTTLSPSQWGALRMAAGTIVENGNPLAALRWLGYIPTQGTDARIALQREKGEDQESPLIDSWPDKRRNKWGTARRWLRELLCEESKIWEELWPGGKGATICSMLDVPGQDSEAKVLRRRLWPFSVRTFLETICEAVFDMNNQD